MHSYETDYFSSMDLVAAQLFDVYIPPEERYFFEKLQKDAHIEKSQGNYEKAAQIQIKANKRRELARLALLSVLGARGGVELGSNTFHIEDEIKKVSTDPAFTKLRTAIQKEYRTPISIALLLPCLLK